jgi:hypothetical protein
MGNVTSLIGTCDVFRIWRRIESTSTQRFFTIGDLGAHVAGKTEPLATCEHWWALVFLTALETCRDLFNSSQKTMRAKNLKRHISNFCHRAPGHLRSRGNRRA